MAAMVGARRALLAARCSLRGELAAAFVSPARRLDSPLPSLPAGRGCLRSLVPYRGAGSLASEQIDGDYLRERGVHSAGNYGEFHSDHPTDHLNRQMQRDLPSAGSLEGKGIDRNRCEHVGGSNNVHSEHNPEQHYRSGGSYGLPNTHQPYTGVRVNNGTPGHNAGQPYGRSSAYSHQSPNGDIPSTNQQHNSTQANNGLSGDGKVHLNDCDTHSSGYNSRSNHQSYTSEQYRYSTSRQSYQSSTGNSKQVFQQQKVDQRSDSNHTNRPGNYSLQYPNPSGSHKEDVAGFQQGYNGDFGYNAREPYGSSSAHNHQGNFGYNSQSNQQSYTSGQYGYSHSGQSYQTSTVNDQQVFQQHKVDERSSGNYTNTPGNSISGYTINPSSFHKEHVAGPQQGQNGDFGYNASQAYQSRYVTIKVDSQRNHPGYSMNASGDVQRNSHGVYQDKHSDIQPVTSAANNLSSTPYQDSINRQHSLPGGLSNGGSPSEVSGEASGKSKGTIEELDKLCGDGKVKEALEVMILLQEKGIVMHAPQYFKLMQACGDASALAEARKIHDQIAQSELAVGTDVINKILDMYAKCASMEDAKKLFSTMDQHDLTSWTTIISGFVHNGLGEEATDFFDQFKQTGDKPDPSMFSHIFMACGILGSVDEGMLHFESMQKDFGITPTMEHYTSIINMLGQSGYIDEAREFIERMPVEPSIDVWESLMNMCRLNGFLEIGDRCAQIIENMDPSRLSDQSKMGLFPVNSTDLAKEKQKKKANTIEARSKVHEYRAGDRSHPDTLKIYEELRYLAAHLKEAGYVADTRFVLHDVDQETKEDALLAHSERLAISYGLMTSAVRSPIRVIKNLRSCGDCHTALKIISKLVGRQIIARDAKRFHHFENGVCSCKDYW